MINDICKGGHSINLITGTCGDCGYQAGGTVENWKNATKDLDYEL